MRVAEAPLVPARIAAGLPCGAIFQDRRTLRSWLAAQGAGARASAPLRVAVIKARPGRRLTLRLRLGGATYYAKCYRAERGRSVARKYRQIAAALRGVVGLRLPALRAADEENGVLLWSAFPGTHLTAGGRKAVSAAASASALRRLGRILAAVHARRTPRLHVWGVEDELDVLRARLADSPAESHLLAEKIAARLPRVRAARLVHRDFYADQVLVARLPSGRLGPLAILDWDDAALGPPALDVGNALAHWELLAVREPRRHGWVAEARRAFLGGYGRASGRANQGAWRPWEAAALLRLSGLAWTRARGRDPVRRGARQHWISAVSHAEEARLLARLAQERLAQAGG